ncbi:ATP-binding protein [Hydrogenophaga sp.]|uniref:hybrid sensor histidine kinase/response regulator n=1 Tax=Hydrogenophaga sp. TaxID=1904254 RepID=UPI00260DD4DD|nr:ATP-binding protein [Hydrogenophaga sp.]MCW5654256.1 response regulator [Hydrogenophaga sp.]
MNTQPTGMARWSVRQWAAAISALLLITLTPLGWIQWQQYRLLEDVAAHQVDSIMWQAYQLERELGRLDESVHNALASGANVDTDEFAERYEVFLSRIDLLTHIPRHDLLETSPSYLVATDQLKAFASMADPLFASPKALLDNPTELGRLHLAIDQMLPTLSELTREANRAVARFVDERNQQLRQQSQLVMTLAAVQVAVMLVFVAMLVRHIRHQNRQYERLQRLSRELAAARDLAEAANRGKSVFLANMSHEIRTPFQGVLGMLNLLDDTRLSGQQRDYVQTARDSAQHLLGVLNDILDVSTMESGTMRLSVAPMKLREVAHEVEDLMRVTAREKGLVLKVNIASQVPEWVLADATRVRQILFNLLGNAVKFTPTGEVRADIGLAPEMKDGIRLVVRDTGIGMDEETLGQIFTRFYQADNSLRRRMGGTGLGLEITRSLTQMMGGHIEVSSELNKGTTFVVTLPLPLAEPPATDFGALPEPSTQRRLRVLVAEDHPINLKYMNILLDKMGHDATFCENGQQALQLLQQRDFDVVLLDYHMPVLDGLATTEAIRALDGPAAQVKVILVTADVVNDTRKRAQEVGVNEFASKPLQAADLQRALQRCGLLEPLSGDEAALRAPTAQEPPAPLPDVHASVAGLIDSESFTEIMGMMPPDTMNELLDTLFAPPEGTVHVLLEALDRAEPAAIAYNAHKLKGTAMLLGFRAIQETAGEIERRALREDGEPATALRQRLREDMARTQDALAHFSPDALAATA